VKSLATGGMIETEDHVLAMSQGYTWDQIVDPDWYPTPRYES
jgi:hypothetical protein